MSTTAVPSPVRAQRQSDRRAEILEAAQRCFVRAGFHQTSMQEICAEAGMSAGNLYRYFPSKEALIAGIAERDRAAAARGDIARDADVEGAVDMLMIIADGVWWRRALDPNFNAGAMIPVFMGV